MKKYKMWGILLLLLACALVLPACGGDQQSPEEDNVLIYAALNPVTDDIHRSIKNFNKNHPDVQIKVRDYSDEGGRDRLQIELALGHVPDIMELRYYGKEGENTSHYTEYQILPGSYTGPEDGYWMPYRQLAQKGYLEDLWPYIENDPELGREAVLEAPLKAAEVNGGLYMLFQGVELFTLMGRESVVGNRYSWTLDDVMEVYAGMPEGSAILRYNMTKRDVFYNLLTASLERYVDRETGACYFDSEGFHNLVGFLQAFPDEVNDEKAQKEEEEIKWQIRTGRQMLEGMNIVWPRDVGFGDSIMGERAAFVGYPTADGSSGNFFYPRGTILAMSSACRNKDAAWEYIRQLITPTIKNRRNPVVTGMPVNHHDLEIIFWYELDQMATIFRKHSENPFFYFAERKHFQFGEDIPLMERLTEEHIQRFEDLVDHTTQLYWPEDDLSNIVWETLGAYFAGDRTLDDTIRLIDNRVGLYLKEQQ